jgi:mannose-6-phosphate isomerase-like protein (cupin superfamily)
MVAAGTRFDLETTYLGLDGQGGVAVLPVGPDFWAAIGENPDASGTLVTVSTGDGDWPHWEMHPNGDEVLVLLEGVVRMIFAHPDGRTESHDLAPGATLVVPRGVSHRAVRQTGLRMLFITYGAGTTHKPVTAADRLGD